MSIRRDLLCAVTLMVFGPLAGAESFYIKPFLQNVSADGVTIIWQTDQNGQGIVEYGPEGSFDQKATGAPDEMIRKVRITGLKPDTRYSYRIAAGDEVYSKSFRTAPLKDSDREVTFVIFGDTRRWANTVAETNFNESVLQWDPEFFLINGDLVPTGHKYELWKEHFDRFEELGGQYMILTARGNHEGSMIHDKENDWFGQYHDLPGGEPYSSFDWGNVHIITLSWEQTTVPALIKDTADWMDKHLATVDTPYTFVSQHFPIYCTGYAGPTDNRKQPGADMVFFKRVIDKYKITAHMSGHTHIYERHYPIREDKRDDRNGTHYLVNGGDINANFPEWWTAYSDHGSGYTKPTYSVYQCLKDRMDIRTFAWSTANKRFEQIDRDIAWKDENTPKSALASLNTASGEALRDALEQLGAMLYAPAIPVLTPYLKPGTDDATRRTAAWALSMIGVEESVDALTPYLEDADAEVRYQAARAYEVAMPERLAKDAAKRARSEDADPRVRVKMIGALQMRAPADLARDTMMAILESDAPKEVRQRAAYALTRAVDEKDIKSLARLFDAEEDPYVTIRLAFTLNKITGVQQPLERGEIATSQPGKRKDIIQKWIQAKS